MFKKIISVVLAVIVLASVCLCPAGAYNKQLRFNADGTFRILQINDFQDRDNTNSDSLAFLNAVLDKYKPDLVVLVGDQLSDSFPGVTADKIKTAISNQIAPIEERGIPFIFTFGNHDRDHKNVVSMEEQAVIYREFSSCYANADGFDGGTYNTVIYGKDGLSPMLNIYMMDSQHWNGTGWTSGVTPEQVEWYIQKSNSLKEMNGGEIIPSLLFQHIPVKEIFKLLKEVPAGTDGAVKSLFSNQYYVLDENAVWIGDRNIMREAPGCENPGKVTGQYEAWLQQGDIIGAYFGHEHINTFVGKTQDGIILGYNGGFGFATYGDAGERYARVFDFKEDDILNYTQQTIYYTQCIAENEPEPEEPATDEMTTKTPDVAEDSDEKTNGECSHICHQSGFMGFIWNIVKFFWKLFKMNPVCECGAAHY